MSLQHQINWTSLIQKRLSVIQTPKKAQQRKWWFFSSQKHKCVSMSWLVIMAAFLNAQKNISGIRQCVSTHFLHIPFMLKALLIKKKQTSPIIRQLFTANDEVVHHKIHETVMLLWMVKRTLQLACQSLNSFQTQIQLYFADWIK